MELSLDVSIKSRITPRPVLGDMTVVIPTLGRPILEQSLYWIVNGSTWPSNLIVVDQGSSSEVASLIDQLRKAGVNAQHVPSQQRGRAAGINRGLEKVETQFIAITDDDCFAESDWLLNMNNHLKKYPEAIVTGRVEAAGQGTIITITSTQPAIYRRPRLKFDSMSGGNMGTSSSVVKRIGLFDEDACMRTAEDAEWSYRALRNGIPIIYAPDVCVSHYGWRDQGGKLEQYRIYARSHGGFYGKYLRRGDMFILMRAGVHILRAARRWAFGKFTGKDDLALYGQAYSLGLLPGMVAGFQAESRNKRAGI